MKSAFDDIVIEWGGETYRLANDMRTIRQVERVVTRPDVREDLESTGQLLPADIAEIFGNLLRHGGADASNDDVYVGLFRGNEKDKETAQLVAMQVIRSILESRNAPADVVADVNPPKPTKKRARSGKKRSSSASAPGG